MGIISLIPTPWKIGVAAVAAIAVIAGSARGGYVYSEGKHAREELLIAKAGEAAAKTAAQAIAQIEVKVAPIRERVTHEIQTEVRYKECVNTPAVMESINEARKGK